jgi:hypothetical protein
MVDHDHRMHARRMRTLTRVVVCLLTVAAGVVAASPPAHAALTSGVGWSARWSYYQVDRVSFEMTLPGVRLSGILVDDVGTRTMWAGLEDTDHTDGRCPSVRIRMGSAPVVINQTTCGWVTFASPPVAGVVDFSLQRTDMQSSMQIPPSLPDLNLRTIGTGSGWAYTAPDEFTFWAHRPTLHMEGHGWNLPGFGTREAYVIVDGPISDHRPCVDATLVSRTRRPEDPSWVVQVELGAFLCWPAPPQALVLRDTIRTITATACEETGGMLPPCIQVAVMFPWRSE